MAARVTLHLVTGKASGSSQLVIQTIAKLQLQRPTVCFGFAPQTLGNYYPIDPKLFKDLWSWHVLHPVEKSSR